MPHTPHARGTPSPRLFLSYAHEDRELVENLYGRLLALGYSPWMDSRDIFPGEEWQRSISRAIRSADFFLFCLSSKSVAKRGFLQKEVKEALDLWKEKLEDDIYLMPVRLEDCPVPDSVAQFQWVDLFVTDGYDRLGSSIRVGIERRLGEVLAGNRELVTDTIFEDKNTQAGYDVRIRYPQIEPSDVPYNSEINRSIAGFALNIGQQFRATAMTDESYHQDEEVSGLSGDYEMGLLNEDLFSFGILFYEYRAGTPHPNFTTEVLTFRRRPPLQLGLNDVFVYGSDYLNALSEYCVVDVSRQLQKRAGTDALAPAAQEPIRRGTYPVASNYQKFVLSADCFKVQFDEWQVGCHATGRFEVTIPYQVIRSVIRPELLQMLQKAQ